MTMTVRPALHIIAEWRKGCSCATPANSEECHECTRAAIEALERWLRELPAAIEEVILDDGHAMVDAEIASEAVEKLIGLQTATPRFFWSYLSTWRKTSQLYT